jgi:hypothetical protein
MSPMPLPAQRSPVHRLKHKPLSASASELTEHLQYSSNRMPGDHHHAFHQVNFSAGMGYGTCVLDIPDYYAKVR